MHFMWTGSHRSFPHHPNLAAFLANENPNEPSCSSQKAPGEKDAQFRPNFEARMFKSDFQTGGGVAWIFRAEESVFFFEGGGCLCL